MKCPANRHLRINPRAEIFASIEESELRELLAVADTGAKKNADGTGQNNTSDTIKQHVTDPRCQTNCW